MLYFQMHKAQVSALWFWDFTFVIWEKMPIDFSALPSSPDSQLIWLPDWLFSLDLPIFDFDIYNIHQVDKKVNGQVDEEIEILW